MRRRLVVLAAALGSGPRAAAETAAPATLRPDYFHTGGRCAGIFAVDRVVREPLPWPGHVARRGDFNVWGLCPPSEQSGVARPSAGIHRRTPVGAFRGANYDAMAYYRPQLDCVMFTRNEVPFCRVCQRALEQVIDLHAGPRRAD